MAGISEPGGDHARVVRKLYLYGITHGREEKSLGFIGIGDPPAEVELLPHGDVVAIVSAARGDVYVPERDDVLAHERVLEAAMRGHVVLPVSFGTVADSREDLLALIEGSYDDLCRELNRLRGFVEVGLKAFWQRDALLREVEERAGSLEALRSSVGRERYRAAIRVGQLVEAAVQRWQACYCPLIMKRLEPVCEESRINDPIGVRILLNAAFLVASDRQHELEREVEALDRDFGDRMYFRYVAPLPPYCFVRVRLQPAGR